MFSTTLGMMPIDPVLLRVGKSFNLPTRQTVAKICIPAMVNPVIIGRAPRRGSLGAAGRVGATLRRARYE